MHPVLKLWLRALPVYLRINEIMKQEGLTGRRVAGEDVRQDVYFDDGAKSTGGYVVSHERDYRVRLNPNEVHRIVLIRLGLGSFREDEDGEVYVQTFVEISFEPDGYGLGEGTVAIYFDARTRKWQKDATLGTRNEDALRLFKELGNISSSRSALSAIRKIAREYKKRRQQA
ncbi:MAG: hypothetical protein Q8R07_04350 [Candidatus Uhrbacteria bacterium]|nr:hypothetical protein [Candidatus Uhrbacteria bacterium]